MTYIAAFERSNRATWREDIEIRDADTGDLIDLTDALVTMTISDNRGCEVLTASTDDGDVTVISLGVVEFLFTADRMDDLDIGRHLIGVRVQLEDDGDIEQLMWGSVNIYEGIDRQ